MTKQLLLITRLQLKQARHECAIGLVCSTCVKVIGDGSMSDGKGSGKHLSALKVHWQKKDSSIRQLKHILAPQCNISGLVQMRKSEGAS